MPTSSAEQGGSHAGSIRSETPSTSSTAVSPFIGFEELDDTSTSEGDKITAMMDKD